MHLGLPALFTSQPAGTEGDFGSDPPAPKPAVVCGVFEPPALLLSAIVTFTALKPGIVFSTLARGPIVVADIGSPKKAIQSQLGLEWNSPPEILQQRRRLDSNKGLYGHALIIGGSLGKSGAPRMASLAALRSGAGLVTCAIPKSILPIVAEVTPELMTEPLDENAAGALSHRALEDNETKVLLERKSVVGIGPGAIPVGD